jgi:hypothetical protein
MACSLCTPLPTEAIFSARPRVYRRRDRLLYLVRADGLVTTGKLKNRLICEGVCMKRAIFHLAATEASFNEQTVIHGDFSSLPQHTYPIPSNPISTTP